MEQQLRTNNHLEGWHYGFNRLVTQHHPNVWRLLAALQQEQAVTDVTIQQLAAGQVINTVIWLRLLEKLTFYTSIEVYQMLLIRYRQAFDFLYLWPIHIRYLTLNVYRLLHE